MLKKSFHEQELVHALVCMLHLLSLSAVRGVEHLLAKCAPTWTTKCQEQLDDLRSWCTRLTVFPTEGSVPEESCPWSSPGTASQH